MAFEKPVTIPEIAQLYGLPEQFVRDACKRPRERHRLPHTRSGKSGTATYYVRPGTFERWYEEEELLA